MSDGPAFQRSVYSGPGNQAEQLLAELQLSVDRLGYLEVPDSARLLSDVQTLIDQIRCELGDVSG